MILFKFCTKCANTGKVSASTGEVIPNDELTDAEFGLRMVEGGQFYKTKIISCPDLDKPKHPVLD